MRSHALRKAHGSIRFGDVQRHNPFQRELFTPLGNEYRPAGFQVVDLAKLALHEATANFSEMGCYKTTTGLWLSEKRMRLINTGPKILIITSKTGKSSYHIVLPDLDWPYSLYNVTGTEFPNAMPAGVYVAHYECFRNKSKFKDKALPIEWDFILLDEAHRIKNSSSQQSKNILRLKSKNRHVMTGSPFINNPSEIFNILKWLYPKEYGNYRKFCRNYCKVEVDEYGFEHFVGIKPEKRQQFHELIFRRGVRRTREEVFKDMPPLLPPKKVYVNLSSVQRKHYDELQDDMVTLDANGTKLSAPTELSLLVRMRQICVGTPLVTDKYYDEKTRTSKWKVRLTEPSTKVDALVDIMEEASHPVVIFSVHRDALEIVKRRFNTEQFSFIHMQSEDSEAERLRKINHFQKGNTQAFLSTLALGSESITLTAADTVVFLERSWSPKDNKQAVSRVARPPQKRPVQPIYIEARGTVDEYVEEILDTKESYFAQVFGL